MADLEKNTAPKAKKPSFVERCKKWFRELKSEIHKIVWPTREKTVNNTVVVLAACLMVGVFIWVLDAVFNIGVQAFIGLFTA